MKISIINPTHEYYPQTLALRHSVLRAPLGLDLYVEDITAEVDQLVFIAEESGAVRACLLLQEQRVSIVKLRQMAVQSQWQRKGLGKQMMIAAEQYARNQGYEKIVLHARTSALDFYKKLGYQANVEPFIEVTIEHWAMEKLL